MGAAPGEFGLWLPFAGINERLVLGDDADAETLKQFPNRPKIPRRSLPGLGQGAVQLSQRESVRASHALQTFRGAAAVSNALRCRVRGPCRS